MDSQVVDNQPEAQTPTPPSKPLRRLTLKQKRFIKEYVSNDGNGSKAIEKVYRPKNKKTATVMASENLAKPSIQQGINKLLLESEYDPKQSIQNIIAVEQAKTNRITGADKLKASELLLKLAGIAVERKESINYKFDFQSDEQAYSFIEKYKKYSKRSKTASG